MTHILTPGLSGCEIATLVPNLFIKVVLKFGDCLDRNSNMLKLKMSSLTEREFNFVMSHEL